MLRQSVSSSPIIPSILTNNRQDFERLLAFAATAGSAGHLDLIDNQFCQGETLPIGDWPEIELAYSEAHLMVKSPIEYLEELAKKKVTRAIIHIEAEFDLFELTETARKLDLLLGYAVNPDTDLVKLRPFLDTNAYIQIMGVHPGRSNQKLIDQTPVAINYLRKNTTKRLIISVDGGVNSANINELEKAGASYFVVAHDIFHDDRWQENYQQLTETLETNDN